VAIQIRVAKRDDLDLLPEALGSEHYVYFVEKFPLQEDGLGEILFAFAHDRLIGTVFVSWNRAIEPEINEHLDKVPMIAHLHVAGAYRRSGVGRRLLREAELALRDRGHDRVLIGVNKSNHSARRLYQRLGYVQPNEIALRDLDPGDGSESFDVYVARLDRRLDS
jgi:GNAT superfamily N-acetyltransferase